MCILESPIIVEVSPVKSLTALSHKVYTIHTACQFVNISHTGPFPLQQRLNKCKLAL